MTVSAFAKLLKQPKALMIGGAVTLLMAAIPGFPALPFLFLAAVVGTTGYVFFVGSKKMTARATAGISPKETDVPGHSVVGGTAEDYALTLPVVLEVGSAISTLLKKDRSGTTFIDQMIPKMRHALYQDLGVRFPGVHVRTDSLSLDAAEYAIHLNEVPITRGKLILKHVLTNETEETLRRYNLPFITSQGALGLPSLWVDEKYKEILQKAQIRFWTGLEVMILHVSKFFRQYANEFIGIQEVRGILEFIEKSFPDLSKEVTRLVPLQKLTEILRRLVQEQISIKDLRTILEALGEWAQTEKDVVLLTEYVRSSLKRYISYKYSLGQPVLSVYLLDPEIEDMVRAAIKQTSAGSYLALDPDSVQLILHSLRTTIQPAPPNAQPPLIITNMDVRRFVRKLIEGEFPDIPVVSYQEIVPEIRIQPLGRVQLT